MKYTAVLSTALPAVFFSAFDAFPREIDFVKEHVYRASELDSRLTAAIIADAEVKRRIYEDVGRFLVNTIEAKGLNITNDEAVVYSVGIALPEVFGERWKDRTYFIKARIKTDTGKGVPLLKAVMKDEDNRKALAEAWKRTDYAFKEIERLQSDSRVEKSPKRQEEYASRVRTLEAVDWFVKAGFYYSLQNIDAALDACSRAIALDGSWPAVYWRRAALYEKRGALDRARDDYKRLCELGDPAGCVKQERLKGR